MEDRMESLTQKRSQVRVLFRPLSMWSAKLYTPKVKGEGHRPGVLL